jgi:glycosyltransferase involved in cell wall biosynthesis
MRIGYIARWWPEFGGSYQYDLFAISALSKASQEVELLVFYSDRRLLKDLAHLTPGVRFIKLGATTWPVPARQAQAKLMEGFSSRIIRGIARRILYHLTGVEPIVFRTPALDNHNLEVCIGNAHFADAVLASCASVLFVHDIWFLRLPDQSLLSSMHWRPLLTQISILNADVIVVDSPWGKQDIIDYVKIDESRISIVPLPTAPFVAKYKKERLPAPAKVSKPYVFYPATYGPIKNHAVILRALRLLKSKGLLLSAVFCGPPGVPAHRDDLVTMSADFGLERQVLFEGWLSDRDIASLYQHAAAVVMASKYGPTNMPIWEGMAFGVPVISSDAGDMPWQVGDAGLLFPPDDEDVLAAHLENVIRNPEIAREYIRRGKRRFSSLEQEAWGDSLLKILKRAVELNKASCAAPKLRGST